MNRVQYAIYKVSDVIPNFPLIYERTIFSVLYSIYSFLSSDSFAQSFCFDSEAILSPLQVEDLQYVQLLSTFCHLTCL